MSFTGKPVCCLSLQINAAHVTLKLFYWADICQTFIKCMFSLVKIDMEKQLVILEEEYEVSVCTCDATRIMRLKVFALLTSVCVCVSEYLSG